MGLTDRIPVGLDEPDVSLDHRALVLDPEPAAVLVGVEAALAEALHVVGQHLALVVVRGVFLGNENVNSRDQYENTGKILFLTHHGLFQVFVDELHERGVVSGSHLEFGTLEFLLEERGVVDARVPVK